MIPQTFPLSIPTQKLSHRGILKGMKKIFVLAGVFVLLAIFPKLAWAETGGACCPGGQVYSILCGIDGGCFSVKPVVKDDAVENCETRTSSAPCSGLGVEVCDSNTQLCVAKTKDATCPPGFFKPWLYGCQVAAVTAGRVCCLGNSVSGCSGAQGINFTNWCAAVTDDTQNKKSITWVAENYCGSGGDYVFKPNSAGNPNVGKCIAVATSKWSAKYTCGVKDEKGDYTGISTAIGCIPTGDLKELLKFLLKFALFASGGIIVLMIIATGYTVMTSGGNPEKLQAAKENVIALFSGLALIAFSLILLYTIGGGVLGLPTF
jgi:hypothetical protein